jgi:hypothetical protein
VTSPPLHWELHSQFTTVRKWFDLSQLSNGSNKRPLDNKPAATLEAEKQPAKRAATAGGDHELGVPPIVDPTKVPIRWKHPDRVQHLCRICNRAHLLINPTCRFNDPVKYAGLANFENVLWRDSKIGKEYHKLGYYSAMDKHANWHKAQVDKGLVLPSRISKIPCNLCNLRPEQILDDDDPFPTALTLTSVFTRDGREQEMITALLDTGSGASFIKPALARRLKLKFYNISTLPSFYQNLTVCGALNGPCNSLTNYVLANIIIGQSPALATFLFKQ